MNKVGKFAYTLSEVMITITVVGVVATLTIANIGYRIQERSRLSQFKAAYSMLETALANVTNERGNIYACYMNMPSDADCEEYGLSQSICQLQDPATDQCDMFKQRFLKSLGVAHSCETDSVEEGCITNQYTWPNGCQAFSNPMKNNKAYILDNSMILIEGAGYGGMNSFAIDVNGRKGPNKWGVDIFPFNIVATGIKEFSDDSKVITDVAVMPPSRSYCSVGASDNGSTKSTAQMWKEMLNVK